MVRLFSWLSIATISMVLVAGYGVYWLSSSSVATAQQDAVAAIAKGASASVSAQIELLNQALDRMAQDPEVVTAVASADPAMLPVMAARLEKHLPEVLRIRLLQPGVIAPDETSLPHMGFADLDMVRETFTKNQMPGIQGDKADRHLAIARQIKQNDQTIGVILASLNYDFILNNLAAGAAEGIYMELKQGKSVLAAAGEKIDDDDFERGHANVANTDWTIDYQYVSSVDKMELDIIASVLIPALLAGAALFSGYKKLSDILAEDLNTLLKAFKDMVTNTMQANYPFKLSQMSAVISNLVQFKRVLDKGDYDAGASEKDALNIIIDDNEDFGLDDFFDDSSDFKL